MARCQRDIALRRAREAEEDEQGTVGDMGDSGFARGPKLRIACPQCGLKEKLDLPTGVTLDEAEDEEEDEAGMIRTIDGECRSCEAEFEIAPPEGYRFSFVPNGFNKQSHREAGEAAMVAFRRSYEGRSDAADAAPDAISTFREAYKHACRVGRESPLPLP